jgi:hypothetical protein
MTISLTHAFSSAIADDPANPQEVRPSNWNAQHTFSMAGTSLFGRGSSGAGAAEEISIVNDSNVTAALTANTMTLGWSGTLPVGRGGTGASTMTQNGVLWAGGGTNPVQVTAQGPTNSVLTASGGPPSFSATPTVNQLNAAPGASNPTSGSGSFGFVTRGAYGGGLSLIDASSAAGLWTDNAGAQFHLGLSATQTGPFTNVLTLDNATNIVCGNGALATNATNGFFYTPSMSGNPSSVPTAYSGRLPIVYDSQHDLLYAYTAGGWKSTAFTAAGGAAGATYGAFGLNVKNYNAIGDGNADDTNAIRNAIAACQPAGGVVFFPPGTYKITSTIVVPGGVSLIGSGCGSQWAGHPYPGVSRIWWQGGVGGWMFNFDPTYHDWNGTVYGLNFDGGNLAYVAMELWASSQGEFRQLNMHNFIAGDWVVKFNQQQSFQPDIYPAGGFHWDTVAIQSNGNNCNAAWFNGVTGAFINRSFFQAGPGGTSLRIDNLSDTNLFCSCDINPNGTGIGLIIQGAGFNNNFINGVITAEPNGTAIYADGNSGYSHLHNVYLGYDTTIQTLNNPNGTGFIWFHGCIGNAYVSGSGVNGGAQNTGDYTEFLVPLNGSVPLPIFSGMVIISDNWNKMPGVYILTPPPGGAIANCVVNTNGLWNSGTSPPGGGYSVGWDGTSFRIYNARATVGMRISMLQTHATATQFGGLS